MILQVTVSYGMWTIQRDGELVTIHNRMDVPNTVFSEDEDPTRYRCYNIVSKRYSLLFFKPLIVSFHFIACSILKQSGAVADTVIVQASYNGILIACK